MKRINSTYIFLLIFALATTFLQAQTDSTKMVKAKYTSFSKADFAYQNAKFAIAADYYEADLLNPKKPAKLILPKLADCYWQMRDYSNAIRIYKLIYPNGKATASKQDQLRIAELYARQGNYQQASTWLSGVPGYQVKADAYNNKEWMNNIKKDSLYWTIGFSSINTHYREYSPFVLKNTLLFTSNKPILTKMKSAGWDGQNFSNLWEIAISDLTTVDENKIFDQIKKKQSEVNTKKLADVYEFDDVKPRDNVLSLLLNERYTQADSSIGKVVKGLESMKLNAATMSMDKNNHIYFSSNYISANKNGLNRICIMQGNYSNNGITAIKQLPFGDPNAYSVMHPAINPEGTMLVFSSDKPNGKGGYDLYYTQRKDNMLPWDALKTFGENINTAGNEVFPTITSNGYLYFSTDALPALGGLDIYRIRVQDAIDDKAKVEQLQYPINSTADDFGWTQNDSTGNKGFFSSDRFNSDDNLYSFDYSVIKCFFTGTVIENPNPKPLAGATVLLYNVTEDSIYVAKTDINGRYRFPIRTTSKVIVKAVDNSHVNDCYVSNVVFKRDFKDTLQQAPHDISMDKFKVGFVWKLSNILYDYNKADNRMDAMPTLDSLVMILTENPITIEIGSHTDSRGKAPYNQKLSHHRAESVVKYLVGHGVDPKRITSKGYGETQPLNRCADGVECLEAEHQANRRTEVKVTDHTVPQKRTIDVNPDLYKDGEVIPRSKLPKGFFDECK